jgi:hypothetical protein
MTPFSLISPLKSHESPFYYKTGEIKKWGHDKKWSHITKERYGIRNMFLFFNNVLGLSLSTAYFSVFGSRGATKMPSFSHIFGSFSGNNKVFYYSYC